MPPITVLNLDSLNSDIFTWLVIPLLIFVARILDVTLGTLRIIFLGRGKKFLAPAFGFFEVLIWLVAIRQIMQNLNNPVTYLAYAAGFAAGNFIGIYLESKLAIGTLIVRIITQRDAAELVNHLRAAGYGVTSLDAEGMSGQVKLIYTVIKRKCLPEVIENIKQFNPRSFVSVEEIQSASAGVFPTKGTQSRIWQKRK